MTSPPKAKWTEPDKCWMVHRRQAWWDACPHCQKRIKWIRLFDGRWSPCNEEPVMYTFPKNGEKSKYKVVAKRDIVENVIFKVPPEDKPRYGWLPHYFSCPVLRKERREWAIKNRGR